MLYVTQQTQQFCNGKICCFITFKIFISLTPMYSIFGRDCCICCAAFIAFITLSVRVQHLNSCHVVFLLSEISFHSQIQNKKKSTLRECPLLMQSVSCIKTIIIDYGKRKRGRYV